MRLNYLLELALKDAWRQKLSLSILASCCIISTAAILAIASLKDNISKSVEVNSKSILGADFVVGSRFKPTEDTEKFLSELDVLLDSKLIKAEETTFSSMIQFENNQATRLVQVNAISGSYPLYGALEVSPPSANSSLQTSGNALLDISLKSQYDIEIGDSISIGDAKFKIRGFILQIPGSTSARSTLAPRVLIPLSDLDSTALIRKGSIVRYNFLYKTSKPIPSANIKSALDKTITKLNLSLETHDDRSERLKKKY